MEKESKRRNRAPVKPKKWTQDESARVVKLRAMGQSPADIAKIMGATFLQVRNKLQHLGDGMRERESIYRPKIEKLCLCCRKPFFSEGAHNRMCVLCVNNSHGVL